jgi:hypothetical protein
MRQRCGRTDRPSWRAWRRHYCGTCKTIGAEYGARARFALNHDAVFLAEVLTALAGEPEWSAAYRSFGCLTLPRTERERPRALRWAAAATVVLTEAKLRDQGADTGRRRWRWARRLWGRPFGRASRMLEGAGFPLPRVLTRLEGQAERERAGGGWEVPTAVATALFFREGARFVGRGDVAAAMQRVGRHWGTLGYWLDAYEDFARDERSGEFNALSARYGRRTPEPVDRALSRAYGALDALPVEPALRAAWQARLRANVAQRTGRQLAVMPVCAPRPSWRERWRAARAQASVLMERAESSPWPGLALMLTVIAFLTPRMARAAESPEECLSLSFNLMALGAVWGMAAGGEPPAEPGGETPTSTEWKESKSKRRRRAKAAMAAAAGTGAAAGAGASASGGGCCGGGGCGGCSGCGGCCESIECCEACECCGECGCCESCNCCEACACDC